MVRTSCFGAESPTVDPAQISEEGKQPEGKQPRKKPLAAIAASHKTGTRLSEYTLSALKQNAVQKKHAFKTTVKLFSREANVVSGLFCAEKCFGERWAYDSSSCPRWRWGELALYILYPPPLSHVYPVSETFHRTSLFHESKYFRNISALNLFDRPPQPSPTQMASVCQGKTDVSIVRSYGGKVLVGQDLPFPRRHVMHVMSHEPIKYLFHSTKSLK